MNNQGNFLPLSRKEAERRGWKELDFILISGDAYVDHPSFGAALIARLLEGEGYRVGIIPQPDWKNVESFRVMGRPRLAFLLTSGNVDSMVNHFTAGKRRRKEDVYSPGGIPGRRPDRALLVYSTMAKQAYKGVTVILGGLEASLRRLSHYDYWSDTVRRSILADAKGDLLVYGMGELQIKEIARRLNTGEKIGNLTDIRGTAYRSPLLPEGNPVILPPFGEVRDKKDLFLASYKLQYENTDPLRGRTLAEPMPHGYIVQNPPALPLTSAELDEVYSLPFQKETHPVYMEAGGVPALQEVRFSLTGNRGCFGDCSFCSLTFHQGKIVTGRSKESLIREAKALTKLQGFKGYIHDVGGPTANFRFPACEKQQTKGACPDKQCLYPETCASLRADHGEYIGILQALRGLPGIKKVFIRSGIRYDYLDADPSDDFLEELCAHHVSGQLKVAPEHVSPEVLKRMGKPGIKSYTRFAASFMRVNNRMEKKQFILPYFISAHPGSDLYAALELALYLKKTGFIPQQVQDFYPTPGTLSTCMYHTGADPRNGEKVYIPKSDRERNLQRALLQFNNPKNRRKVREALREIGREDLIGRGKECLVPPEGRRAN